MFFNNGIKIFSGFLAAVLLSACSLVEPDPEPKVDVKCTDPRPEICTMDYQPVCGVESDGSYKVYSNGCSACSNPKVIGYNEGECN